EVDRPSAQDFQINPVTPAKAKGAIELGGSKIVGEVKPLDVNYARQLYGSNAVLRTLAPGEPGLLQVSNYNCHVEVTRVHILRGTGRSYPEQALRGAAALEGHVIPGEGMTPKGYFFLIQRAGGKAWAADTNIRGLKAVAKAGYFVELTVKTLGGGRHSVEFRGFIERAGVEHAVFGDPYFGSEIALPTCDFLKVWAFEARLTGKIQVADFGQASPLSVFADAPSVK
ncbi:MAG: hypothetical protein ACRD2L_08465, partial [Terriglobia bacterium]